jgi:hypothetical protein
MPRPVAPETSPFEQHVAPTVQQGVSASGVNGFAADGRAAPRAPGTGGRIETIAVDPTVHANGNGVPEQEAGRQTTCTTAQLRRFIKSRPWVPMHELRRRFAIWGGDDDVAPMRVGDRTLFIGLPLDEARMVAELLAGGDVGYELSLDPVTPVVVGVYPMRPVPRS